tara:strand:+ start:1953 stop:2171 length:219 start_codon:yes stop_codon:yes gene_type:complete
MIVNRNLTADYNKYFDLDSKQAYNWNRKRIRATIKGVRDTRYADITIMWLNNLNYLLRQRRRLQWKVIHNDF